MSHIEFRSVSKSYSARVAVRDFTLGVEQGERIALLGPSGCGKTTVLRLLLGLAAPDSGSISIGGQVVSANGRVVVPPEKRNIGMVFQDLALWPHLTVEGNLRFGLQARRVSRQTADRRISETLGLTGLEAYARARPASLSGGQQQRVALARALVLEPEILALDEPLSSLNIELNMALRKEIRRLHEQLRFTLIYVTHNRDEAFDIASRLVLMDEGCIVRSGSVVELKEFLGGTIPISGRP